ncbi:MAG: hypothetical protein ABI433_07185 [Burkholderiaceae bacterium]
MELLSITLAVNETKQFAKAGRYFEIVDSTYALSVAFYGANGAQSDQMIGALSGLYLEDSYSHFSITNGATAQTITLLVMEVGRGGSRRQPGNVRIIDSNADKTLLGKQFIHSVGQAASAGNFSLVGLAPNGARVSIKRITVSSTIAGLVLSMVGTGQGTGNPSVIGAQNKLVGGAVSTARITQGIATVMPPTAGEVPGSVYWTGFYIPANTPVEMPLSTPIILQGTNVVNISGNALNRDIAAVFDFEEL